MGGHVFKDAEGQPLTQRIAQTDVKTTVGWLEQLTGLDLSNNMLGSTGKKETSGDLDLGVDANQTTKEQLMQTLARWCQTNRLDPKNFIKKSGISVHFCAPINGRPSNGWVQVDFMFVQKPAFSRFSLWSAGDKSKFKGAERNIMINSIAKSMGYKLNQNTGIMDRATNELISDDPDQIAKMLINPRATRADLESVESIVAALQNDPKRDMKLADAKAHFEREGIPFFESADPYLEYSDEVSFMARLRDRIVNKGMVPIFEADEIQGGHAKGIEHFEDLVFRKGSAGIKQALAYVDMLKDNTVTSVSAKLDGKPAVIFGRKPDGQFVLTDTSGFTAAGYDGLFTNPKQLTQQMVKRDEVDASRGKQSNRAQVLGSLYSMLWPLLEQSLPKNFKGYVQGDLLYTSTPTEQAGNLVFTPNTITYRIPVNSELGQEIADSQVGIAVHTRYDNPGDPKQPLGNVKFNPVQGLLLIQPIRPKQNVQPEESSAQAKQLKQLLSSQGRNIDLLFNPTELRNLQISDLPRLCVDYINALVKDTSVSGFSTNTLLPGFIRWLQTKVTPRKFANIREYLQSPTSNGDALAAAFSAFIMLHDIKMDLLKQLDRQHPGQEGWVIATPGGVTKFVNRFDFSRANALKNKN